MVVGAFRNSLALGLILLGALLSFPASLALWEQQTLAHEEQFIALGRDIIDEEPVQTAIADAIAAEIARLAGISTVRIQSAEFRLDDVALEAVKALADSEAGDLALRGVYMTSRRLAQIDDDTVQVSGNDLVIDLRPTVRRVVDEVRPEEPALQGLTIPDDLGYITITNARDAGIALDVWRGVDAAAPYLIVAPFVAFALALLIATGRGFSLFLIGALVAGGAAMRIFLLQGPVDTLLKDLVTGESVYGDAGLAVYSRIVSSYARQEVIVLIGGVVVASVGLVTSVLLRR